MFGSRISVLFSLLVAISPLAAGSVSSTRTLEAFSQGSLEALPMGTFVGQLQERWQFPSDHLPIGMSLGDLNIVSWNVLSAKCMSWVTEANTQGLSHSLIADEHVYIGHSKLTIRDRHVVDLILQMLQHPDHPKHLIALQECTGPFLSELKQRLAPNFAVVFHKGESLVFDQNYFDVVSAKEVNNVFLDEPGRIVQEVVLQRKASNEILRLVNVHLPGDPTKPGRFQFARYLADTFNPSMTTLAMGDMNFNELEMADAMQKAFVNQPQPFSIYSPYCTNISPDVLMSKAIDHFIVYSGVQPITHRPEEVMVGLDATAQLLNSPQQLSAVQP